MLQLPLSAMKHSIPLIVTTRFVLLFAAISWSANAAGPSGAAATPAPAVAPAPASSPAATGAQQLPPDLQQALQMPAGPDQTKAVAAAAKAWGEKDALGYLLSLIHI